MHGDEVRRVAVAVAIQGALRSFVHERKHVSVDHEDNVLITDTENHVIRKYQPRDGRMVRVAGTGTRGDAGVGGPPDQVGLARPHGAFVDPAGAIYISDSSNHRILKIEK